MGGSNSVMIYPPQKLQHSQQNNQFTPQKESTSSSTNKYNKSFSHVEEDDNIEEVLYTGTEYFDRELPVWFYSSNYGSSGRKGSLKKTRSLVMNTDEECQTPQRSSSYQKLKHDSPPSPTHFNSSPQPFSSPRQKPSLLSSVLKNSPQGTPPPVKSNQVSPNHQNSQYNFDTPLQNLPTPSIPIRRVASEEQRSHSAPTHAIPIFDKKMSKRNSVACFMSESYNQLGNDNLHIIVTPPSSPPEHTSPSNSLVIRSIDSEMRMAKREKRERKKRMLGMKKKQQNNVTQLNLPPLFQKIQLESSSFKTKNLEEESKHIIKIK